MNLKTAHKSFSVVILFLVSSICVNTSDPASVKSLMNILSVLHKSSTFLKNDCTLQLYYYENTNSSNEWLYNLDKISSSYHLDPDFPSNGITVSKLITSTENNIISKYTQPEQIQFSSRCSFIFVLMNVPSFSDENKTALKSQLIVPLIRPSTVRNRDHYTFLSDTDVVRSLHESKLFNSLKYKIILEISRPKVQVESRNAISSIAYFEAFVWKPCQYGLCKGQLLRPLISLDIDVIKESISPNKIVFPDNEKNFHGHMLRLSTTTKVPQLLEMNVVKNEYGKDVYLPKRGLYAKVLEELCKRLNFTWEIVPSSGGGSTGHVLPNGTWLGILGDVYREQVDFGFMAAITYSRFPFAEFCAPINFAYIGFVTGPPRKKYAWNAIFWPFNIVMWVGLAVTVFIASTVVSVIIIVFLHVDKRNHVQVYGSAKTADTFINSSGMLLRVLLEQSNIPKNFYSSFRTFIAFWLIFCLVCSVAYQSKMVSLLTFPVYDPIPNNFDELAVSKDFAVDFHYFGNIGYTLFKTSTNPSIVSIFNRMGREPDPLKCLTRTLHEKAACIIFIGTFEEILFRNLSDVFGKSPLKFTPNDGMFPAGVIHKYHAPLSANFKSILSPAMETGLMANWQGEDLNQVLINKNEWQKENNIDGNAAIWGTEIYSNDNLLRVRNLTGAFIIFGIGLTAAIFTFVFENFRKFKKRNMSSRSLLHFDQR